MATKRKGRRLPRRHAHRTDKYRPMRKGDLVIRRSHARDFAWKVYGVLGRIIEIDAGYPRAALVEFEDLGVQQLCYTSDLRRVR